MSWRAQLPDLNPIENIWAIIKQELYTQSRFPKTKNELIDRVMTIWENLQRELLVKLFDGVVHRLNGVIDREGGWFKK